MIEGLENDLSRLIVTYKNRMNLFSQNGQLPFYSEREVVRYHLFAKAEKVGLLPIPNMKFLRWQIDLVAMKGIRAEYAFAVRKKKTEDYRHLLMFPKSTKKVLVALRSAAVPADSEEMGLIVLRPLASNRTTDSALSVRAVIAAYTETFREVYGFLPNFRNRDLTGPAAMLSGFWKRSGEGLGLREYCKWYLSKEAAKSQTESKVVLIRELANEAAVATYKRSMQPKSYDDKWTKNGGWDALDV